MDGFEFREKYIDENDDTIKDVMTNGFEDDGDDDDDDNKKKSGNFKKKIVLIIFITVAVVLVSLAALTGYALYRDDKPPVIVSSHIESDNFDDHTVAKYGSMITLSFTFDKELRKPPMVVIQDKTVDVYGEGKEYYAKYFVQSQGAHNEVVSFSIHDYRDNFNKTGKPVTVTTDLSNVTILGLLDK